jgi:GWxTD domain-containing protein
VQVSRIFTVLVVLLVGFSSTRSWAQVSTADFDVDVVSARGENATDTRVDLFTRVPVTQISFINTPNGFTAGYEVKVDAIEISDDNRLRNLVQSKIWDATLVVDSYAETQLDDEFDYTTQSINLKPGRYIFEFQVSDKNSSQLYLRSIPVDVRDMSADVAISDINLLQSYDEKNFTIIPRITGRVGSEEGGFKVFYELYSDGEKDVIITQEVRRSREDGSPVKPVVAEGTSEEADTDLAYSKQEMVFLGRSKSQYIVTVPMDDFKVGTYQMVVSVSELGGEVLAKAERRFAVEWSGLTGHIEEDIDEAIAQMEYVAKKRELSFIQEAPNDVERYQRFRSFWEKRDPTPGTLRNERMEEYYYRIASANRNYGGTHDGWKTDRGFVLVRFGEPDFVRKKAHSFDYEPYEVWEYQRIGRQFIFVDKTGFGDYELLVPVWDERTRLY